MFVEYCFNPSSEEDDPSFTAYQSFHSCVVMLMVVCGLFGITSNLGLSASLRGNFKFQQLIKIIPFADSLFVLCSIIDSLQSTFHTTIPQSILRIYPIVLYPLYRITISYSVLLRVALGAELLYGDHEENSGKFSATSPCLSLLVAVLLNTGKFLEVELGELCWDFRESAGN
ncbi:uncharacterized protein LOC111699003 [Eurytemora carolleeae]|uniref:uncharacterized protein LOC111699003 n=1 Tax=Eurytemora carolleeae TaxID=1294199 RepID=UPI000C76FDD3|nr:uncharacterized protein LOC111699003 [Eurytemora carolleeae]|eukprot:XP_023325293.1 uncharacterized protein LOC111699003 [Eurytemora affinis]